MHDSPNRTCIDDRNTGKFANNLGRDFQLCTEHLGGHFIEISSANEIGIGEVQINSLYMNVISIF